MTSNDRKTIALVALAGIAIVAALWMLVISPKREERAQVRVLRGARHLRPGVTVRWPGRAGAASELFRPRRAAHR